MAFTRNRNLLSRNHHRLPSPSDSPLLPPTPSLLPPPPARCCNSPPPTYCCNSPLPLITAAAIRRHLLPLQFANYRQAPATAYLLASFSSAIQDWKKHLDRDVETLRAKANILSIQSFLNLTGIGCSDFETICIKDQTVTDEDIDKMIGFALSHHLKKTKSEDVVTENEFEKKLLADVIPSNEIGVTFDDIGALETVKDTLKELVMLLLQRPELFCELTKVKQFLLKLLQLKHVQTSSTYQCPTLHQRLGLEIGHHHRHSLRRERSGRHVSKLEKSHEKLKNILRRHFPNDLGDDEDDVADDGAMVMSEFILFRARCMHIYVD